MSTIGAGDVVTVPRVVLSRPGFVMIHRAQGDYPGEIVMTGDLPPVVEGGATVEEKFLIQ